jgi:hypothetical protein
LTCETSQGIGGFQNPTSNTKRHEIILFWGVGGTLEDLFFVQLFEFLIEEMQQKISSFYSLISKT